MKQISELQRARTIKRVLLGATLGAAALALAACGGSEPQPRGDQGGIASPPPPSDGEEFPPPGDEGAFPPPDNQDGLPPPPPSE